jgi:hypothetical protein
VECGSDLRTPKERAEIEMRLRETEQRQHEDMLARMRPKERWAWAGGDESRLHLVARISGYKAAWVRHRLQEFRAIAYAKGRQAYG